MRNRRIILWAVALLAGPAMGDGAYGQTLPQSEAQRELQARYDAHHAEFDFLLGDWEFVQTRPGPTGPTTFRGYWSATRSADGALITDEFRIVDDSNRTTYVGTTLRVYSPMQQRWNLVGIEPGFGVIQLGTAWKEGSDMRVDQIFGLEPNTAKWRIRYYNIGPERFSWRADRSLDGGTTWVENYRTIEARRVGPARAPGALTPPSAARKGR